MTALLIGTLDLENGCLVVHPLGGGFPVLPIWPPEFTLHADEERLAVINTSLPTSSRANASIAEQAVAIAGQEICMGGGYVTYVDEWVRQQIPPTCPRAYFIVGQPESVRPNLYPHSELFAYEPLTNGERSILFLRYKPAFLEQAEASRHLQGTLVLYEQDRFLRLETGQGPGPATLLWPSDWDLCFEGDTAIVIDANKQEIARIGDSLTLKAHPIAQSWESEIYQRATKELPCDACCNFWLVEGVASTP
jgi:hypothetical protein